MLKRKPLFIAAAICAMFLGYTATVHGCYIVFCFPCSCNDAGANTFVYCTSVGECSDFGEGCRAGEVYIYAYGYGGPFCGMTMTNTASTYIFDWDGLLTGEARHFVWGTYLCGYYNESDCTGYYSTYEDFCPLC